MTVQLSEGVRSFQVLPYGGGTRGGGAAEDIDVQCFLPPDVSLQACDPSPPVLLECHSLRHTDVRPPLACFALQRRQLQRVRVVACRLA